MAYILNRTLSVLLTLFLISVITFLVTNILPGDVAMMIMGTQSNPEALAGLRQSLGLNDPLIVQYGRWVGGLLTGDWGNSLVFKEAIGPLIAQKVVASGLIVLMSMTIALRAAIPLGICSAMVMVSGKRRRAMVMTSDTWVPISSSCASRGARRAKARSWFSRSG